MQHPAIAECAVMGLPDQTYGEIISAVVVPHESLAAEAAAKSEPVLTLASLTSWARERMAPYKVQPITSCWVQYDLSSVSTPSCRCTFSTNLFETQLI